MRQVGVMPDSFLAEFGPQQFEVTCAPALGLRAADDAVITRELARAVAFRLGHRVSFTPIPDPDGTGNGTHIHWSFLDRDDQPVLYEEQRPWQLSPVGQSIRRRRSIPSARPVRGDGAVGVLILSPAPESLGAGAGGCRRRWTAARRCGSVPWSAAIRRSGRDNSMSNFASPTPRPAPTWRSPCWCRPDSTAFAIAAKSM